MQLIPEPCVQQRLILAKRDSKQEEEQIVQAESERRFDRGGWCDLRMAHGDDDAACLGALIVAGQ